MAPLIRTLRSVLRFRKFETNSALRRLSRAASVGDLRRIAQRQLPGGIFDYIDGAAEDERSLYNNSAAFSRLEFKPSVLCDVSQIDTRTTLLGHELPFPLALSPTGFTRIANSQGELAVARAAQRAGLPYTLSSLSTYSIEEVAAVSRASKWFQVYVWKDRGLVKELLDRSAESGYEAIVITVDTPVLGRRDRDARSGFTLPPQIGLDTIISGITHPGWTLDFLRGGPITFANLVGRSGEDGSDAINLAEYTQQLFDPRLSWSYLDWFRDNWKGPIVLKGVQSVEDAQLAADAGVQAVALSNHGGRQLDDSPAPLELVQPVADAVGDRVEIICDGGIRRGSDILKALALGARCCMTGRAYLYGLGAGGERGVDHAIDLLRQGLERTMALTGQSSVKNLKPDLVARKAHQ